MEAPISTWFGVTVEGNHVTQLDLRNNQLSGSIPPELGNLVNLEWLTLGGNKLGGSIPPELGDLHYLRVLDLSSNQLSGSIPVSITQLPDLVWLNLNLNQLDGSLPPEIEAISTLEVLGLGANRLSGEIPPELGMLTNLRQMELSLNQFSGSVPAELDALSNLEVLGFRGNQLEGAIPPTFSKMTALDTLLLQDNQFEDLPDLSALTLDSLRVEDNRLTFEDIEPNVDGPSTFIYAPQANIGSSRTEYLNMGESLTLSFSVGGQSNEYQWYKDDTPISGATRDTYTINSMTESDAGVYTLEISNTEATALTLTTEPITVTPPLLHASLSELAFGAVAVGDTVQKTVTIENTGNVALAVQRLSINGTSAAAFSTETPLPFEIGPEQASAVTVAFAPSVGEHVEAILEIDSNAGAASVDLSGSGVAVGIELASSPTAAGESKPVSVFTSADFQPTDRRLFYRQGGAGRYQQTELQASEGDRFTGAIPAEAVTERGVDFYVELTEGPLTVTFPAQHPATSPVHLRTQSAALAAAGSFEPEKYRMVSVPVVPERGGLQAVLSEYGDYDPQRWRLLRWDPQDGAYRELEARRGFSALDASFVPGVAFWLVTLEGNGFSVENGQSVDGSQPFQITLEPGWNQVANPFAFPVAWSRISGIEALEGPWSFDTDSQAFHPCCAQSLQPWSGYFVNNTSDAPVTLSVPPVEASAEVPQASMQADRLDNAEYAIQLVAQVEDRALRDAQNYVGFMKAAQAGRDRLDWAEPPPVGEHVRLSVMEGDERLARSFKPIEERGQFWDMEVTVEARAPFQTRTPVQMHLSEKGSLPEGFEWHVIDRDTKRAIPVKRGRFSVPISREYPVRHLRLIVGTRALAKAASAGASLEVYTNALRSNYPNPFVERTTIGYELKEESPVEIVIYDVLGRRVQTLVEGRRRAGAYQVQWDGRNAQGAHVASGMYFYRIQAGDFEASQRMLLMR